VAAVATKDKRGFWKTLPGIITAAAGLISAIAALIGGLIAAGVIGGSAASGHNASGHRTSGTTGGGTTGGGTTGGGTSGGGTGGGTGGGNCTVVALSDASTLHGTYSFDFDSGTETQSGADVWWDQQTDTVRSLDPQSEAAIVNLGAVDLGSLSCDVLRSEPYASAPIDGNNDGTNHLTDGDVFAVRTDQGNYAKVQVVSYGYDLELRFETYQAS